MEDSAVAEPSSKLMPVDCAFASIFGRSDTCLLPRPAFTLLLGVQKHWHNFPTSAAVLWLVFNLSFIFWQQHFQTLPYESAAHMFVVCTRAAKQGIKSVHFRVGRIVQRRTSEFQS